MAVRMENSAERSFEYFTKIVFIISPPSPESPEMNWKIPETVLHPQENRMREFRQKATVFADPYCTDYYAVLLVSEDIRRNRPRQRKFIIRIRIIELTGTYPCLRKHLLQFFSGKSPHSF